MVTLTEENYIKAIYHLGKQGENNVSTNAIAKEMETKASSVSDMVKKLSEKGYADYKKYQGVTLTKEGKLIAVNIVRKHRLWEVFLSEKLNFSWDEIHDVAEQLEHIKSEKLIKQLDAFLDYPSHDPHGDPIPDENGRIQSIDKILLSQAQVNNICICVGVKDSSSEFLKYLDKHGIALGTELKVTNKEPFDNSITITINHSEFIISNIIANNLFVKLA
ncbi:metal-dependent transcriptional regulator [Algibacter lectus]|uniref:Transcriptional regulator MntR n=1 Tax=Algibacter lectus TaxID=221126 RepID=A0A090V753_9FLAO|nr:metal-dependent transcriptional regulator [Algibacter lectus]GAL60656.1 Mn-dependent transcriptional regulator MntR [Algibacter lectus]SFC69351.1 iron (metal) dependent repressor, DtxR family [Algibacter lectus]